MTDAVTGEEGYRPGQVTESAIAPDLSAEAVLLDRVLAALGDLHQAFDAKIRYDDVRERRIEALHAELETHRQGLYRQILRPVLTDLVGMHDDLAKLTSAGEAENGNGDSGALARGFTSLRDSIEETLLRNGVTIFVVEGNTFVRTRQKVIEVDKTDQPELDRRIARRLRPGFELDGKVLRPEWVAAYRYVPTESL
jgi:molecular chaperone GrpE (heat shock protein)